MPLKELFLLHKNNKDVVVLNRNSETSDADQETQPLEFALCRECGQHYYVGREKNGKLEEAIRDPSHSDFGVDFYLPLDDTTNAEDIIYLCRQCGRLGKEEDTCGCSASISVNKCEQHEDFLDQIKKCKACGYSRARDPVREVVHGSDGPNSVIATALHGLLPEERRKILAFTDSRQDAAFFAWYAEHSYQEVRNRNFILRALKSDDIYEDGLSIADLRNRLHDIDKEIFELSDSTTAKKRKIINMIFRELVTEEKRISLEGVGLARWHVALPKNFQLPDSIREAPWNLSLNEGLDLVQLCLKKLCERRAITLSRDAVWKDDNISQYPQQAVVVGKSSSKYTFPWANRQTRIVKHYLCRLHLNEAASESEKCADGVRLMEDLWGAIFETEELLIPHGNGAFRLNSKWMRITLASLDEYFECDTCARLTPYNIRNVCVRNDCKGKLIQADSSKTQINHYRILYQDKKMPAQLRSEEHTAQLSSEEAESQQNKFITNKIDLLSSSTTFEVGVDLGDLEAVFLRNVPPEPFNYAQRVGRAGRRDDIPGLALTYCQRKSHDLYHYADPEEHLLKGKVQPPKLSLRNEKIILRHITAIALSAFFRETNDGRDRFKNVEQLLGDWKNPTAVADFRSFCLKSSALLDSIKAVVPEEMHNKLGLDKDNWINSIAGDGSRFAEAEKVVKNDYFQMRQLQKEYSNREDYRRAENIKYLLNTISKELSINFLSRKAIIPKYGFPVDVVELDTRPDTNQGAHKISLQRDLSQAIAEYAPGSKVVANKKLWESCGVKVIPGKKLPIYNYTYNEARDFQQSNEHDSLEGGRQYLSPKFGFVTELFKQPADPQGRTGRLYTTRPFFQGFVEAAKNSKQVLGVDITPALPGRMVVLCEGKNGSLFYICRTCGSGYAERQASHKTPEGKPCDATLDRLALGHEFVTDVVRLQFPELNNEWSAYSLAYSILLGTSQQLGVPDTDLNTTITASNRAEKYAIILYDNVPGGAGLVARLAEPQILKNIFTTAIERIKGACGCTESCYGCIRSYRNQFAHPYLQRKDALDFLEKALSA